MLVANKNISTSHLHVIFISKTILHPLSMFIILGNTSRRLYMQNNYVRATFKTLMPMPFHGTAWFIGILIMAYHKSHIIRYHNPLHPGNHTRLERKKGPFFSKEKHRPKPSIPRFWPPLTWGISVDIFTQVSAREMHIVPVRIGGLAFGIGRNFGDNITIHYGNPFIKQPVFKWVGYKSCCCFSFLEEINISQWKAKTHVCLWQGGFARVAIGSTSWKFPLFNGYICFLLFWNVCHI